MHESQICIYTRDRRFFFFFITDFTHQLNSDERFYRRRPSGQTVVAGVFLSPRYLSSFIFMIYRAKNPFSIPNLQRFVETHDLMMIYLTTISSCCALFVGQQTKYVHICMVVMVSCCREKARHGIASSDGPNGSCRGVCFTCIEGKG